MWDVAAHVQGQLTGGRSPGKGGPEAAPTRESRHFSYAVDRRFLPMLAPFLLRPSRDGVTITEDRCDAAFGIVKITTPRTNITGAHITRNYRWWTACGVRMSFADDGLTFGTNHDAGVCIHFADKVRSPMRRAGHSALTVTVEDLEGLVAALGGA